MPSFPSDIVTVVSSVILTIVPSSRMALSTVVSATLPSKLVGWSTVTMGVSVSSSVGVGAGLFCSRIAPRMIIMTAAAIAQIFRFRFIIATYILSWFDCGGMRWQTCGYSTRMM